MIKSVFVPLQGYPRDKTALDAAFEVAALFDAHVECLHVRPDPRLVVTATTAGMETGLGVGVFPETLFQTLLEADKRRASAARNAYDTACKRRKIPADSDRTGFSAHYGEQEGDVAKDVTHHARFSDLVVLAREPIESDSEWDATGDVILGCGRPILLAPLKGTLSPASPAAIAWKDTAEAARALTGAMPLLAKAGAAVVLCAPEHHKDKELASAESVAALLRRHDIDAHAELVDVGTKTAPEAVMDRAVARKAGLLVMGAYGRSRLREFVFGGFTRHALGENRLPILLAH